MLALKVTKAPLSAAVHAAISLVLIIRHQQRDSAVSTFCTSPMLVGENLSRIGELVLRSLMLVFLMENGVSAAEDLGL